MTLPPYTRMCTLSFTSNQRQRAQEAAHFVANGLRKHFNKNHDLFILGPSAAMMEKRMNQYTWNVVLRAFDINQLHKVIHFASHLATLGPRAQYKIDVDPLIS